MTSTQLGANMTDEQLIALLRQAGFNVGGGARPDVWANELASEGEYDALDLFRALLSASKPAEQQKPVCWIQRDQLEQVEDEGNDAWVYWAETGHIAESDEVPLYTAAPAQSAEPIYQARLHFDVAGQWSDCYEATFYACKAYPDKYETRIVCAAPIDITAQSGEAVADELIESALEASDGRWHEDEFRINGKDLMALCKSVALLARAESPAAPAQHTDDIAIDRFAAALKEKMAASRAKGRGGWEGCEPAALSAMLREHVEKGDPRDVANFCMMLWFHSASIAAAPAQSGESVASNAAMEAEATRQFAHLEPKNFSLGDNTSNLDEFVNATTLTETLGAQLDRAYEAYAASPQTRITDEQRAAINFAIGYVGEDDHENAGAVATLRTLLTEQAAPQPSQPAQAGEELTDEQILEIAREYQTVVPGNCLYILEFARALLRNTLTAPQADQPVQAEEPSDDMDLIMAYEAPNDDEPEQSAVVLDDERATWADEIIDCLQSSFDTEGITDNDSGDALIRLSSAIAAVEEVAKARAASPQATRCPACNANDADMPCAFPEGGQPGCPRDMRLGRTATQPAQTRAVTITTQMLETAYGPYLNPRADKIRRNCLARVLEIAMVTASGGDHV